MLAASAVFATAGALLLSAPAADAAVTAYRTTTQYIGGGGSTVNVRTSPALSASIAYTRPTGYLLSIDCQTVGSKLGFGSYPDNRTWDKLSDGRFVHDVVTTTPGGSRQNLPDGGYVAYSPTIPQCGAAVAPVASSSTGGYPDAAAADCSAQYGRYSWCESNGQYSSRSFNYRNCTDFVAWKYGFAQRDVSYRGSAHAYQWFDGWTSRGRAWGDTPRVGSIAWWGTSRGGGYGHVGAVIAVNNDGSAQVAQYNADGHGNYSVDTHARAEHYLYR